MADEGPSGLSDALSVRTKERLFGTMLPHQGEQKHVEKTDQSEEQHPDRRLLKASGRDDAFQPSPVQHKQMISIFHNREKADEGTR